MRKFTLWMLIIAMTMLSLLSGCSQTNSQSAEENTDTGQPEKWWFICRDLPAFFKRMKEILRCIHLLIPLG